MMPNWKNKLNKQQLKAVCCEGRPLLVLAGAGSGKTRVLTYRAFWLIKEKKIDPRKIILLTFTNKAAGEMTERVKELLTQKFHLGGDRVGRQSPKRQKPSEEKFLTDSDERHSKLGFAGTFHAFCVRLLRMYGESAGIKKGFVIYDTSDQRQVMKKSLVNLDQESTAKKIRMYLAIISKYKNNLLSIKDISFLAKQNYQKTTVAVWREYQRLLNKFNAVDFDDLLVESVKILKIKEIRSKIHRQFDWVLVDEYQDTNKAQFELTRLLTNDANNLMVVGDASQAIYSFRGADFRNLILLKSVFENLKIIELVENYRSTQNILDAAHGVIDNNTGHPILNLRTKEGQGEKIKLFRGENGRDEARFVMSNCKKIIGRGESAAVLYRTNAQSRILEEELIRAGIKYRLVGGVRFYERKEIKDVLALIKAAENRNDLVAWDRIEKIGKRKKADFEAWLKSGFDKQLTSNKLIEKVLEVTKYLDRFDKKNEEDLGRLENINELMAVANQFPKTEAFLENVALIQAEDIADQLQTEKALVNLMTIHAAKGLEFDHVFIVGLEEGLLPHSRSLLEKEALEEERRLLYVAITRARRKLFLSFAGSRFLYGSRNSQTPSRFLGEIPERLIASAAGSPTTKGSELSYIRPKAGLRTAESSEPSKRRIVQDWEVEKESRNDFNEIDSW